MIAEGEQENAPVSRRSCHSRCAKFCQSAISFLSSYTLIWSVISEILLLTEVYSDHDSRFFVLSCTFLVVPLVIVSFFLCLYTARDLKHHVGRFHYIAYIPIINVAFSKSVLGISDDHNDKFNAALTDIFLTGTMTFPLYILLAFGSFCFNRDYTLFSFHFRVLH